MASDFVKGDKATLENIKSHCPSLFSLSTLTLMEIEYGLLKIPERRSKIDLIIQAFTSCVEIFLFCEKISLIDSHLRHDLNS